MKTVSKIILYFIVACSITWVGNLVNYLYPGANWWSMFALGPILAAPLVIWMTDGGAAVKAWWKRIWRFNAPLYVYFCAIFVPLAIFVVSTGLAMAMTGDRPTAEAIAAWPDVLKFAPLMLVLGGPGGEEPGFRGYGQHELQKVMTPLTAACWIGLGVVVWHFPVFIEGNIPISIAACLIGVSVVYAWLYQAGGSVWPLVILHLMVNSVNSQYLANMLSEQGREIEVNIMTVFFIAWALLIAWRLGPNLGHPVRED